MGFFFVFFDWRVLNLSVFTLIYIKVAICLQLLLIYIQELDVAPW